MVNQKAISVRIDTTILWEVDQEAMLGYATRNRIINLGAQQYVDIRGMRRIYGCVDDLETKRKIIRGLFLRYFPEALQDHLF